MPGAPALGWARGREAPRQLGSVGPQNWERRTFSSQAAQGVLVCTVVPGDSTEGPTPSRVRWALTAPHSLSSHAHHPHGPGISARESGSLAKVSGRKGWGWLLTPVALLEWGAVGKEPLKGKNPLPLLLALGGFLRSVWGRRFAFLILSGLGPCLDSPSPHTPVREPGAPDSPL